MNKYSNVFWLRGIVVVILLGATQWVSFSKTNSVDGNPLPPTSFQAARGLSQTLSAETMGFGRLSLGISGSWYKQMREFSGVPVQGTDVTTGTVSFSFGVNSHIDIFAAVCGFGLFVPSPAENDFGLGTVGGGIGGSLPLPERSPLRLGAQIAFLGGTASNQINNNGFDGYNYFETRTGYDFIGRAVESIIFGDNSRGVKFHFNEGVVMSLQQDHGNILLLAAGIEGIIHPLLVIGIEANSRTLLSNFNLRKDPLWITPSLLLRTPYYFSVLAGCDVSLSRDRETQAIRALEPFRLFGNLTFSFDLLAAKRREMLEREKRLTEERDEMERKVREAQARADSIAQKAREDSIAMARERELERLRADSLARKAQEDSIALAKASKQLSEEREKRSDMEKQLLSTGLLLLDAVYFETGKAEISINSRPYLTIIGKMLLKYPKLQIEIGGHTDNTGRYESNMSLSQARAEAVRSYLIMVAPELANRLSARGYGPTMPKADNRTADGRKINRRVELQVMNKEALKEYNP